MPCRSSLARSQDKPTALRPARIIRAIPVAFTLGARLGPYEIIAQIGAGGMGEVYRATDTNLGRDVALKVLPDTFAQDSERWRVSSAKPRRSRH